MVFIDNGMFFSAIKKNEILSFAGKWMELESIILGEGQRPHVLSHMWNTDPMQTQQCHEKQVTLRGCHTREREGQRRKLRR
jgi:hypothetical protein